MRRFPHTIALAVCLSLGVSAGASADRSAAGPEVAMKTRTPTPEEEKALLAPYRARINALDSQIVTLLGQRFDVVREVAVLKAQHGIHPILPDRIEEVVQRARAQAEKSGVDPKLVERLYRIIIDTACQMETDYAHAQEAKAK